MTKVLIIMAQITLTELIEVLKSHPDYKNKWQLDVPAEEALYISFEGAPGVGLDSVDFVACDGNIVVLDKTRDGKIAGIGIT